GEWVADVERPAAQYRGRYQEHLAEANGLLAQSAPAPAPAALNTAPAGPASMLAPNPQAVPAPIDPAAVVAPSSGAGSPLGLSALQHAHTQLHVHEIGSSNTGPQVNQYLAAAGVPPGNPWCASFVTWSLGQAGHKMPGGGWGAVATWVHNAQAGNNDLHIVSADQAQ